MTHESKRPQCVFSECSPSDFMVSYSRGDVNPAGQERVHFRFKSEGQDKDWREVVNETPRPFFY
jgi:hypothetical protein